MSGVAKERALRRHAAQPLRGHVDAVKRVEYLAFLLAGDASVIVAQAEASQVLR